MNNIPRDRQLMISPPPPQFLVSAILMNAILLGILSKSRVCIKITSRPPRYRVLGIFNLFLEGGSTKSYKCSQKYEVFGPGCIAQQKKKFY